MKVIGGRLMPIRTADIHIPFDELRILIDVSSLILEEDVPSMLSMLDRVENRLEISIQSCHITFAGRKKTLAM